MGKTQAIRTYRSKGEGDLQPLYLVVTPNDGRYDLLLAQTSSAAKTFRTGKVADIDWAARSFNAEANRLHLTVNSWNSSRPARRAADIERLRGLSAKLASTIFPDGGSEFADALATAKADLVIVAFSGERLGFPWQLLWIAERGKWLGEYAGFMATHEQQQAADFSGFVNAEGFEAAYAEDDGLTSARKDWSIEPARHEEFSALYKLSPGNVSVRPLRQFTAGPLNPAERDDLASWLCAGRHVYHFACHASGGTESDPLSSLLVRTNAKVTANDLRKPMTPGAFLLNVCSSSVGVRRDTESLANAVLGAGARCGVAVTNDISDRFGTLFARTFYREMSRNGGRLLPALRTSQKLLLRLSGHPMALFYTLHGDSNYVLKE